MANFENFANGPPFAEELVEKWQFFQRVLKMGNFGQTAKGGPFAKFSKLAIFLAQLR